jgi:hypothetical protein
MPYSSTFNVVYILNVLSCVHWQTNNYVQRLLKGGVQLSINHTILPVGLDFCLNKIENLLEYRILNLSAAGIGFYILPERIFLFFRMEDWMK